jgi:phage terminase small subunit
MKESENSVPKSMKKPGRSWLKLLRKEYVFSPAEWRTAIMCGECVDLIDECNRKIQQEGLTVEDRFGQVKAHPLLTVIRDAKSTFRNLYRSLGLDVHSGEEALKLP